MENHFVTEAPVSSFVWSVCARGAGENRGKRGKSKYIYR